MSILPILMAGFAGLSTLFLTAITFLLGLFGTVTILPAGINMLFEFLF